MKTSTSPENDYCIIDSLFNRLYYSFINKEIQIEEFAEAYIFLYSNDFELSSIKKKFEKIIKCHVGEREFKRVLLEITNDSNIKQ